MNPTRARLDLLQAIADGAVTERYSPGSGFYSVWDKGPGSAIRSQRRYHRVTARTAELNREGLIRIVEEPGRSRFSYAPQRWDITAAGRMFLEANGGAP